MASMVTNEFPPVKAEQRVRAAGWLVPLEVNARGEAPLILAGQEIVADISR